MRLVYTLAFVVLFGLQNAQAQSPAAPPPGAADPTQSPPAQLVAPPRAAPALLVPPAQPAAEASPGAPATPATLVPDDTGLCQCLYLVGSTQTQPDQTSLGIQCMSGVAQCTAACQTTTNYSFVPHAGQSCPNGPQGVAGHVALNMRAATRILGTR